MSTNHIKKNKKMNKQKRMTKTKRNRKSKNRKNIKYISKKVMKGGSICDLFNTQAKVNESKPKLVNNKVITSTKQISKKLMLQKRRLLLFKDILLNKKTRLQITVSGFLNFLIL